MKFIFGKFAMIFITLLFCFGLAFAQAETEMGIGLYGKGEYGKAVKSLQKAVKENKKDRRAWLYLGASFLGLKKENKAAAAFRKARGIRLPEIEDKDESFKIISKPKAEYTVEARMNQVQGIVSVAVEFGAGGSINFALPLRWLDHDLTENAVKAARQIKFEPAMRNGKPVSVIKIVEYSFSLY